MILKSCIKARSPCRPSSDGRICNFGEAALPLVCKLRAFGGHSLTRINSYMPSLVIACSCERRFSLLAKTAVCVKLKKHGNRNEYYFQFISMAAFLYYRWKPSCRFAWKSARERIAQSGGIYSKVNRFWYFRIIKMSIVTATKRMYSKI